MTDVAFQSGPVGAAGAVSFTSHYSRVCQMQYATNLGAPAVWNTLPPARFGIGGLRTLSHTNIFDRSFYRIEGS